MFVFPITVREREKMRGQVSLFIVNMLPKRGTINQKQCIKWQMTYIARIVFNVLHTNTLEMSANSSRRFVTRQKTTVRMKRKVMVRSENR